MKRSGQKILNRNKENMSSDESTGTHISTVSSKTEKDILKPHKPEQWEIDLIGDFVLKLYHQSLITPDNGWCIKKADVRKEFEKNFISADQRKKLEKLNGTANIGTLLHRCGFLIDTPRSSNLYRIKNMELFRFRNLKLKQMDDLRINKDNIVQIDEERLLNEERNAIISLEEDNIEVDEVEPKKVLKYQATKMQPRTPNYYPTNTSCWICEEDFPTIKGFEDHIQMHGEDTDFDYLCHMEIADPICTLSYRLCKNSHYFCFEIETSTSDLMVEKIILVQSHSFYSVNNIRFPYKIAQNKPNRFFIDSHLFTIHVEQPIVLICYVEGSKDTRIIEQHHFMRTEEFPKINFAINPNRLPSNATFKAQFKLADYFPPEEILDSLKDDFYHEKIMKVSNEFREYVQSGKKLQSKTIRPSLKILLQIEDIDTLYQYRDLTQRNIELRTFENEYSFRLQPTQRLFIENILSPFDEVVLTTRTDVHNNPDAIMKLMMQNTEDLMRKNNAYVGQIVAINGGRVSFKCDKKINIYTSFTVICRPSRLTIRYQYRSLELLDRNMVNLRKFLFPSKLPSMSLSEAKLNLYNDKIALVPEQLQAVRNIADGPRNDATYIIFGPPGTGKTTTLVEAILQLLKKSKTKILVTASSNSACDEIALRLTKYLDQLDIQRCLVRVYARSSEGQVDTIDDNLLEYSNMYCGQFYPDINILHEYRVVVCTLSVVAKLATGKFGRDTHGNEIYTHLFIDEVAASMEVDALLAITTILKDKSSLIISGDHKQLGPILKSKRAQELGLDISLMERLLERECYRVDDDTGNYDRTIQTRLRRNYRSHPAIVNLYSGLYYNHNVEPHCKIEDVSLGDTWYKTRKEKFPIIFHAIYEPSMSDRRTTSLYNPGELKVVMDYLKDLMYFGINGKKVNQSDIGIISPYKRQYKLIQEELNLRKWFNIETGSVEIFQGKEKDVIIVSFVRSGTRNLGFLDSARRLNVTLSRAKSILILIGNPNTLSKNSEFDHIIKECQRHNTFVGQRQNKENETMLTQAMQDLCLSNETINVGKNKRRSRRNRWRNRNRNKDTNVPSSIQTLSFYRQNTTVDPWEKTDENKRQQSARMYNNKCQSNEEDVIQNSGGVSKENVEGKLNNPWDRNKGVSGEKIDKLFDELPKIPNKPLVFPTDCPNLQLSSPHVQTQHYNIQQGPQQRQQQHYNIQQGPQQQQQYYNMQQRPQQLQQHYNIQHIPQQPQQQQHFNIQQRPQQQQQQYCNNNMGLNFVPTSNFYNTQYPILSPSVPPQQQLVYTSPYHKPFQSNIDLLPSTSGGANQMNKNCNTDSGAVSNHCHRLYYDRNPFNLPKKTNESENKFNADINTNSNQSPATSNAKENSVKNEKEKLATAKVTPMPRSPSLTLSKTERDAAFLELNDGGNSNVFSSSPRTYRTETSLLANAPMSREDIANTSTLKLNDKLPSNHDKTHSPLAIPTKGSVTAPKSGESSANTKPRSPLKSTTKVTSTSNTSTLSLNSAAAVTPKGTNLTDAKTNVKKLNIGSNLNSSSSSIKTTGTPLGSTSPMSKEGSANTSNFASGITLTTPIKVSPTSTPLFSNTSTLKSNNTAAVASKGTNLTDVKANVGKLNSSSNSKKTSTLILNSNLTSNHGKAESSLVTTATMSRPSTSTLNSSTAAVKSKETNAMDPKRNIVNINKGLFPNVTATTSSSSSRYKNPSSSTLNGVPVNTFETRRESVVRSNKQPQQDSKCCIS